MLLLLLLLASTLALCSAETPAAAAATTAVYPPFFDVSPFVGLHFFYWEPVTRVIQEVYVKSNVSLDSHVWLGSVAGAQCSKDQLVNLVGVGDGMVRIAYEEPTGAISSHVLDTNAGAGAVFSLLHRVTLYPNWMLNGDASKRVNGCNQYDGACLAQILAWRDAGPLEPQTVAQGAPLPILFMEKVAAGNDHLINCALTLPSPFVQSIARTSKPLLALHSKITSSSSSSARVPIMGFFYTYHYVQANSPSSLHQSFDLYVKNMTRVDFKLKMSSGPQPCVKNQLIEAYPLRADMWRLTWRGNKNKNFQTNLVKPGKGWDLGESFMGLASPTVDPRDPHPYPHLYSEGIQWAVVDAETFVAPNNDTAMIC